MRKNSSATFPATSRFLVREKSVAAPRDKLKRGLSDANAPLLG
jgi:hypothetical protein